MTKVTGIHHITAIASDPQQTYDFYSKILGLRLVKKSVNQDDVQTYHLFFGDKTGEPGMDLTFFTFQPVMQGVKGVGQVTTISLGVPKDSFDFWVKRLDKYKVRHDEPNKVFGIQTLFFYDNDGQKFELVAGVEEKNPEKNVHVWTKEVQAEYAIRHFDSATLSVMSKSLVEPVLFLFGYEFVQKEGHHSLYKLNGVDRASYLQVDESPDQEMGINAAGTVHHIAFQVKDEKELEHFQHKLLTIGLYPTEVIDRYYFRSVYFRTHAGILFELATLGPGFAADEKEEELGEKLALPPFLEHQRQSIEARLTKIRTS
jgi:glyoxalase family protein